MFNIPGYILPTLHLDRANASAPNQIVSVIRWGSVHIRNHKDRAACNRHRNRQAGARHSAN